MATNTTDYDVIELNAINGEIVYRNFTNTESAQREIDLKTLADQKLEAETNSQAKAALLERLGITAEEAALLVK
jgi:hypothetical protein